MNMYVSSLESVKKGHTLLVNLRDSLLFLLIEKEFEPHMAPRVHSMTTHYNYNKTENTKKTYYIYIYIYIYICLHHITTILMHPYF